jgi:glycosyltransferase involved in cell wall biosynthesis
MKILNIHTQGGAIGYYRHWMPAKAMKDAGFDVTYYRGELDFFHDVKRLTGTNPEDWLFKHGGEYDIVHMGYSNVQQHATLAVALRNHALVNYEKELPIITDIDDDPINVPSYNTAFRSYTGQSDRRKNLLIQLRASDAITCTTPTIPEVLRDEGRNFSVLPNFCEPNDWDHFPVRPERDDDNAVYIAYAGGPAHLGDLEQLSEVGPRLTAKYDGKEGRPLLRWIFVGFAPPWAEDMYPDKKDPRNNRAFFVQPCQLETFHRSLRWLSPDIMIAPVEQNVFNESKSLLKAYDAVTANAAFVCQDWATYEDVPESAAFKVRGDVQWQETLEGLIENPDIREKRAKALREWVLDERQIKDHIMEWIDVYEQAMKRPVIKELSDIIRPRIIRPDEL